jgi:hypothetical protein
LWIDDKKWDVAKWLEFMAALLSGFGFKLSICNAKCYLLANPARVGVTKNHVCTWVLVALVWSLKSDQQMEAVGL